MRERVLRYIRGQGLMRAGDRVGVAVSGGADSVALLRVLLELRDELGVVVSGVLHFNHKLRAEADDDERFVRELAERHGLEFVRDAADVAGFAAAEKLSVETAARELRQRFFHAALRRAGWESVATAHTADDQAETVLMRILRGTGTEGLAGIAPFRRLEHGRIVRPLLGVRRREVEGYLRSIGQGWRDDPSNRDLKHTRNRVRHELLPALERDYNPSVVRALNDLAEIARAEEQVWEAQLATLPLGERYSLAANALRDLPVALQRRLLRRTLAPALALEFEQVEALRALAAAPSGEHHLPGGWTATREGARLVVRRGGEAGPEQYEYPLAVPGEVEVPEVGSRFVTTGAGEVAGARKELVVRNWRAGDRFHAPHSSGPKKVKELLTEKKVGGRERALWPVVAAGDEVVWLRGWGMSVAAGGSEGLRIEEVRSQK